MIYTTKQAAEKLKVSVRTITNYCVTWNVPKIKGKYQINKNHIADWLTYNNEAETTERNGKKETESDTITETFEKVEYDKLLEVVNNHKLLLEKIEDYRNEIKYLRKTLDNKDEQMKYLIDNVAKSIQAIQQGNFLLNDKNS